MAAQWSRSYRGNQLFSDYCERTIIRCWQLLGACNEQFWLGDQRFGGFGDRRTGGDHESTGEPIVACGSELFLQCWGDRRRPGSVPVAARRFEANGGNKFDFQLLQCPGLKRW